MRINIWHSISFICFEYNICIGVFLFIYCSFYLNLSAMKQTLFLSNCQYEMCLWLLSTNSFERRKKTTNQKPNQNHIQKSHTKKKNVVPIVSTGLNRSVRDHFKLVIEVCRAMWIPAFQHILCSQLRLVSNFLFLIYFIYLFCFSFFFSSFLHSFPFNLFGSLTHTHRNVVGFIADLK